MQNAAMQLRKLELARHFRGQPPTMLRMFRRAWRAYALLVVVIGLVAVYFYLHGLIAASSFLLGLLVATLIRDLRWHRQLVRDWPLSNEITDWEKVDELIIRMRDSQG